MGLSSMNERFSLSCNYADSDLPAKKDPTCSPVTTKILSTETKATEAAILLPPYKFHLISMFDTSALQEINSTLVKIKRIHGTLNFLLSHKTRGNALAFN